MTHLPSEMAKVSYTFGQGAFCSGPIPSNEVTDEIAGDVAGSAEPRPMTLDEAIEVDQQNICYNSDNNPEKVQESINSLKVHRDLRDRNWRGLIPSDIVYCEQLKNQLRDRCQQGTFCTYQHQLELEKSLGIGDDGKIYPFSLDPQADYAMFLAEEQGHDG